MPLTVCLCVFYESISLQNVVALLRAVKAYGVIAQYKTKIEIRRLWLEHHTQWGLGCDL